MAFFTHPILSDSYSGYWSRVKPVWLGGVDCSFGNDRIKDCNRNPIVGFDVECNSFVVSVAEVNCGNCTYGYALLAYTY